MDVIKGREVRIAVEVKRSDAGDVLPVAMFSMESSEFRKHGLITCIT